MAEDGRPTYVGPGMCKCGRIDVLLYRLSNSPSIQPLACAKCLEKAGVQVPKPRTADDIEVVDGELRWKR